jgi:DtxR family transcriptional regulator, Mn-dependent transcriptional regulator
MKFSASKENYLKTIYHLQQSASTVATNALAAALCTQPASVTDMLKKLKAQKLLQYEKYKGVKLTAEGKRVALQIIRKHRLWEFFLVEKLQFGWEEVHEIAEELEHVSSKKLIDKLDAFLGFPEKDPHGDPIPNQLGQLPVATLVPMLQLPLHTAAVVSGIVDQSSSMLALLNHKKIFIGSTLQVKGKFEADGSMEIQVGNEKTLSISALLAKNILVNQ